MRLGLPGCALALGLGAAAPAYADYFNCEYSPRCEAIENQQCAPSRNLKDKFALVRSHNSAEEVEKTWVVLAGFEPEYCKRLGYRGNIVVEFLKFKDKTYPKLYEQSCGDPQACADVFVRTTRERWARDDLDAKIKADLQKTSQGARTSRAATADSVAPATWETTTTVAAPPRARTRTVQSQ